MDIKIIFFLVVFGLSSAQKKKELKITIFQEKPNDSISVVIKNESNIPAKILLDSRNLGLPTNVSRDLLYYIFGSLSYTIENHNKWSYKGQQYLTGFNYGYSRNQTLLQYVLANTHILLPTDTYRFKIDFNELSFCKDLKTNHKLLNHSFKVSYFGNEIIEFLKKEYIKNPQDLSVIKINSYFNQNISSNIIKLKGCICY